jgi:hypothetical protein
MLEERRDPENFMDTRPGTANIGLRGPFHRKIGSKIDISIHKLNIGEVSCMVMRSHAVQEPPGRAPER